MPETLVKKGWLGSAGATEDELQALEARLGMRLPPTYRSFLQFTNGWHHPTPVIDKMWGTDDVDWFSKRHQTWIDAWRLAYSEYPDIPISDAEYFVYGQGQNIHAVRLEYMAAALEISETSHSTILLLNPKVVDQAGEWEAWLFANWLAGAMRFTSFWNLMIAEFNMLQSTHENYRTRTKKLLI